MALIRVENFVINTDEIAFADLSAFLAESNSKGVTLYLKQKEVSGKSVKLSFRDESAKALRRYFNEAEDVQFLGEPTKTSLLPTSSLQRLPSPPLPHSAG